MELRVLKSEEDYRAALGEAEKLVGDDPPPGSKAADRLELLTVLIEAFEENNFPLDLPDPISALEFRMEEQGLRQKDLIAYLGSRSRVSEVLSRKRPLTVPMIRALSDGLGIPANVLIGIPQKRPGLPPGGEPEWAKFPYGEMKKRGWLEGLLGAVGGRPEEAVKAFFARAAATPVALFRRTIKGEELDERAYYSTLAWTARVLIRAKTQEKGAPRFDPSKIDMDVLRDLARLSWLDKGPLVAVEFLLKLGVIVVVEPRLPNTLIDGATMLTEGGRAVIALTLRIDRVDYFWFTLLHECVHAWKHLRSADEAFIDRLESEEVGQVEKEASRLARDAFIPRAIWKRCDAYLRPSREAIQELADQLHIHPAVVAGRLQHETGSYERFREFLGQGKIRRLFSDVNFS